jgi:dihydroflavonol-4-reductase
MVSAGGTGFVHLQDAADGDVAAMERGQAGERYLLAAENLSNRDIAATVLELLGRRPRIVSCPRAIVRGLGWVGTHLKVPLPFNPAIAPYVTLYWFVDGSRARRELGINYRPAREAVADALGWLKASGKL